MGGALGWIFRRPRQQTERLFTFLCGCLFGVFLSLTGVFSLFPITTLDPAGSLLVQQQLMRCAHLMNNFSRCPSPADNSSTLAAVVLSSHGGGGGAPSPVAVVVTRANVQLRSTKPPSLAPVGPDVVAERIARFVASSNFRAQGHKLAWIKTRILSMNDTWATAYEYVQSRRPILLSAPKKILAYPGLLTENSPYDFAGLAFKGGYLGELVQWSDLLAALVSLGHEVVVETSQAKLLSHTSRIKSRYFDLVYSDYIGLTVIRAKLLLPFLKCRMRLLDSFGTEPRVVFSTRTRQLKSGVHLYSKFDLESFKQYLTLYPHSPDNSFLGHVGRLENHFGSMTRSNQAVVYGKEARFFTGMEPLLKTISKFFTIHTTVADDQSLRKYLPDLNYINHGLLPADNLSSLLASSKLYIGMGFPYEGPGPVEALAAGCNILLGHFKKPRNSQNTPFFSSKPTRRYLHSQHPYLTDFVGEPLVYTEQLENRRAIKSVLEKIMRKEDKDFQPHTQHEFTAAGFAERLASYVYHQNFCTEDSNIALDKPATSTITADNHKASEAVAMDVSHTKCVWLQPCDDVWWQVDLCTIEPVDTVVIDFAPDWHVLLKMWGSILPPFRVLLLDAAKMVVASTEYRRRHAIRFEWQVENGPVLAQYVKLVKLNPKESTHFILCNVGVYRSAPFRSSWPEVEHMKKVVSKPGQSCVDACMSTNMVCEPTYFPELNKLPVLKELFNCTSRVARRLDDGLSEVEIFDLAAYPGYDAVKQQCATNLERLLLDCSGSSSNVIRLCPCRSYQTQQVALPPFKLH